MMSGTLVISLFVIQILGYEAADVYYHEISYVKLKTEQSTLNSDFGFSLAYQSDSQGFPRLVVGSPHSDPDGHVYSCPTKSLLGYRNCDELNIDIKKLDSEYYAGDHHQKFCLGASVIASSNYLLTCAPLWTTSLKNNFGFKKASYGTCFIYYNDNKAFRVPDLVQQFRTNSTFSELISVDELFGGFGWSSILDETNKLIIIGKQAIYGDIYYMDSSLPHNSFQSIRFSGGGDRDSAQVHSDYFKSDNIGYAFALGNFFADSKEKIYYAFSLRDKRSVGKVSFLQYDRSRKRLHLKMLDNQPVEINPEVSGNMFGAALSGADVNADGFADILLGAPAHTAYETDYETGALYIYLGGDVKTITSATRRRVILGGKHGSRFGTTIATRDLDGDSLPEIFVSAPYEDKSGALYILSGYEVTHTIINSMSYEYQFDLTKLVHTQRILGDHFRSYGFSLQIVPDVDDNGCDELAVGIPNNATVVILRCVPTITASISTKLIKQVVKETDKDFTVEVCVDVTYNTKSISITTKLWVICEVTGNKAEIKNPTFNVFLNKEERHYCENITVEFKHKESGHYSFSAELVSDIDDLLKNEKFDPSWVRLNPHYSKLKDGCEVSRHCSAESDCVQRLEMQILWAGSDNVTEYPLDSRASENVTVIVTNVGASVYDGCVRVRITGAFVLSIACGADGDDGYRCYLPNPLNRGAPPYKLDILVSADKTSKSDSKVHIEALLYNNCNYPNYTRVEKNVNLILTTKNIHITGYSHKLNVTDSEMLNKTYSTTFVDRHEYLVFNNGSLTWQNISAVITLPKKNYVQNYTIITSQDSPCLGRQSNDSLQFSCNVDLQPESSVRVTIIMNIIKEKFLENLVGNELEITSKLLLIVNPRLDAVSESQSTTIVFVKELSIGNNKTLLIVLAIIGGFVILAVTAFILYKLGFFERKEKKRLDSYKASINSRSIKQSTTGEQGAEFKEDNVDDMDDFDMEVIDECPFEVIEPVTEADNAALIVEGQVDKPSTSQRISQDINKT